MAKFTEQIQAWILASEGGYVDHPSDPGGATNMGITHKTLAAWRGVSPYFKLDKSEVRNLKRDEALRIYKAQYWDAVRGDELPEGLDYAVFDYGVNSGPSRAIKELQRVLGVTADGIIGVQTLDAISRNSAVKLIEVITARRLAFVRGLKTYSTFGRGWERRINDVASKASKLAVGVGAPNSTPPSTPEKANPEKPSATDSILKDAGGWSGIGGIIAAIFGAIADQPILQVAAVAFIAFLLWRFVIARKQADPT